MPEVCVSAVENLRKAVAQTFQLNTVSTASLLNISQSTTHVRFLDAALPQADVVFAQTKFVNLPQFFGWFYSLSPTVATKNELNKGFHL